MLSLHAMSRARAFVMPTALGQHSVVYGPHGSWQDALRDGLIWDSHCGPATQSHVVDSDYRFSKALGSVNVSYVFTLLLGTVCVGAAATLGARDVRVREA